MYKMTNIIQIFIKLRQELISRMMALQATESIKTYLPTLVTRIVPGCRCQLRRWRKGEEQSEVVETLKKRCRKEVSTCISDSANSTSSFFNEI